MGGLFGGGGGGSSGPSEAELKQQRLDDSREYWSSYQEQRRNIVDQRSDALKDLTQMMAVGGLSSRAGANRKAEIQDDYDRQWNSLHSGSTYGLLQDVYREQGASGTLEDYFSGQWGVIEPLAATSEGDGGAGENRQRAAALSVTQEDEQQRSAAGGRVYTMT